MTLDGFPEVPRPIVRNVECSKPNNIPHQFVESADGVLSAIYPQVIDQLLGDPQARRRLLCHGALREIQLRP